MNGNAEGRVSVNANVAQEAAEQLEVNATQPNLSTGRRAWNRAPFVPENLDQVLLSEEIVGTRPVLDGHLRVPIIPPKLVSTCVSEQSIGINNSWPIGHTSLRSSSGSLIQIGMPSSRFSSSTVNGAPPKEDSNKWFLKSVKSCLKHVSHTLSGKKEKNETSDALSSLIGLASEKARPIVVENCIDEVARPGYEVIAGACDTPFIVLDRAATGAHGESSGNRAKKQPRTDHDANAAGPTSQNPPGHQTITGFEPPSTRDSVFSAKTSTSSSSEIQVPTNAELREMVDALSEINRLAIATQRDRTTRRCISYVEAAVASEENASPSPSHSHAGLAVPMNSQGQAVEAPLRADHTSIDPPPFYHRQFTSSVTADELSTDVAHVPAPILESRRKTAWNCTRLQTLSVDVTAQEIAIGEEDKTSTPSSDIEVSSDSQLQLLESFLCGSDKALSFSDSGIGLVAPGLLETKDADLISVSSSDFLVPTDSQLQLMEDLLCGESLADPAPLTDLSKSAATQEDGEGVSTACSYLGVPTKRGIQGVADNHTSSVFISLPCGPKSAGCTSVGSPHVVVPTESNLHAMANSFPRASACTKRGFLDSAAYLSSAQGNDLGLDTSSDMMVPTDAEIHAMELALMSCGPDSSPSTDHERSSDPGSCMQSANSSPLFGSIERDMLSSAGRAATARRSANRDTRQTEKYNMQPKRSALHKEPDIVEVDRATGLPVKSNWREVHFAEKGLVQVVVIPREPATVDMSYIVPDPDPVQMTADKVFLNTACLMPRTDVPGMRLERVLSILNITSPRPVDPPTPYRPAPANSKGSLLPEFKVELSPEDTPRRSPWANHSRFFDYDARVKSDPYTLGEHKELVLWRNRHRFGRRTSLYLPGVPVIIRDSKNVLRRASQALEDHICRLGLNKPRKLPMQMPVRSAMVHNAHFLLHTEAEECPCGKSRKFRHLDGWFKPTNISAYAITEVLQYAEDDLRDPETDSASGSSNPNANKTFVAPRRARANRVADSLLACGAYRTRQLAHPLVTEYSHLYDLHPRRLYISTPEVPGLGSAPRSGSVLVSQLNNTPPPFDLSRPELVVPQLIATSPSSQSAQVSACSGNSFVSGLHFTCPRKVGEPNFALHESCAVNSVASSSGFCPQAVSRKASDPFFALAYGTPVIARTGHAIASKGAYGDSHIIELSSDGLQQSHRSGVSSSLPMYSATSGLGGHLDPSGSIHQVARHASDLTSNPVNTLYIPSTTSRGSLSVPFIRAVTSRALLLPNPSLSDLSYHQA